MHQGVYFQRPWSLLTLCTAEVPGRLDDPRTLAGGLYDMVLLEQVHGVLPAPWVGIRAHRSPGGRRRRSDPVRLNRKMVAALSGGTAWSEDLFSASANKISRLLLRSKDPGRRPEIRAVRRPVVVDRRIPLRRTGPRARKAAFRAFLKDKRSKSRQEESFFQHFGFGFGTMLDDWRRWVLDRGIGADEPPPPRIRDALLDRVLPVIRDRRAPRGDRIQAIRDWRKAGYPLGADALIDLLRDPGDIPKPEIIGCWAWSPG